MACDPRGACARSGEQFDRDPLALAGVWDGWRKSDGQLIRSFVVIITEPSERRPARRRGGELVKMRGAAMGAPHQPEPGRRRFL